MVADFLEFALKCVRNETNCRLNCTFGKKQFKALLQLKKFDSRQKKRKNCSQIFYCRRFSVFSFLYW